MLDLHRSVKMNRDQVKCYIACVGWYIPFQRAPLLYLPTQTNLHHFSGRQTDKLVKGGTLFFWEKTYNAGRRGYLFDNSLSADNEAGVLRLTIRFVSSLLRLLACIRTIVSRSTFEAARNWAHRFVTLPAASDDDPVTADFNELRGGASDEVTWSILIEGAKEGARRRKMIVGTKTQRVEVTCRYITYFDGLNNISCRIRSDKSQE